MLFRSMRLSTAVTPGADQATRSVDGDTVILTGRVRSWVEKQQADRVAVDRHVDALGVRLGATYQRLLDLTAQLFRCRRFGRTVMRCRHASSSSA